jgi:hypothetical protein
MRVTWLLLLFSCLLASCEQTSDKDKGHRDKAEEGIKEWIRLNAKYSESYSPHDFDSFEYIGWQDIPNKTSEFYIKIKHAYTLDDVSGEAQKLDHVFVLDDAYRPSLISFKPTSLLSAAPPSAFAWSYRFSDTVLNVEMAGLSQKYYHQRYQDWKFLTNWAIQYENFDYINSDYVGPIFQNSNETDSQSFTIKRILTVMLNAETELDKLGLHDLGMSLDHLVSNKMIRNIVVLSRETDNLEEYCFMEINPKKTVMTLNNLSTNQTYIFKLARDGSNKYNGQQQVIAVGKGWSSYVYSWQKSKTDFFYKNTRGWKT